MSYNYHKIVGVIPSNREIMAQARETLRNKWIRSIACNIVVPLVTEGIRGIAHFGLVLLLMLISVFALKPWMLVLPVFLLCLLMFAASLTGQTYNQLGSLKWYLSLHDTGEAEVIASLKYALARYVCFVCAILIGTLIVIGKTLLLVIPGIMAYLDYAMVGFCMADDPNLGPCEALKRSRAIMYGHRWRLYCLWWRFFGWILLCIFSCGIGFIWLVPYIQASHAAFYRSILPKQDTPEFAELPMSSGKSPLSKRANMIILLVIALFWATALTIVYML